MPGSSCLTPGQRERYALDGFLVLPAYLDEHTVDALRETAGELEARLAPIRPGIPRVQVDVTEDGNRIRLIEPVVDLSPVLATLSQDERIVGLFQSLFDETPVLFEDKLNYKSPRGGSLFPMHQDYSYWQAYSPRLTSALIYLDEATEENGCLQVVPGWYRKGLLPKTSLQVSLVTDHHVPAEIIDPALAVPVPGPPGTTLLFSCLTPHTSAPNRSDRPRRALILTYNPASDGDTYEQRYGHARPTARAASGPSELTNVRV